MVNSAFTMAGAAIAARGRLVEIVAAGLSRAQMIDPTASSRPSPWAPAVVAALIPLVFAALYRDVVTGPDVAWQLWIAHQIRMGARLYVDIVETNPPLWFWEAVPLDWVASYLHIPSHALLVAAVGIASSLSVLAEDFSREPVGGLRLEDRFLASGSFADLLHHYRRSGSYRIFDVYQLKAPFPQPPAATCRRSY